MDNNTFSFVVAFLSLFLLACQPSPDTQNTSNSAATSKNNNQLLENLNALSSANDAALLVNLAEVANPKLLSSIEKDTPIGFLKLKSKNEYSNSKKDSLRWSEKADKIIEDQSISAVQRQFSNISFPKLLTYFLKNLR